MTAVLERGDIAFLYRPRVDTDRVRTLDDVQRFFVLLHPHDGAPSRRLIVGAKRLPDPDRHERFWAYVDLVADDPDELLVDLARYAYLTRTRGVREQPAARIAGEGGYAIIDHDGDHAHLSYRLDGPGARFAEDELRVHPEASFVVAVRNPDGDDAPRFVALAPRLLDQPGVDLILIAAADHAEVGAIAP